MAEPAIPAPAPAPSAVPAPAPTSALGAPRLSSTVEHAAASTRLELFRMTAQERGCPPLAKGDCTSSAEIHANGRFDLDPWGAPGVAPLQAKLTPDELQTTTGALTASGLLALLDRDPACRGADRGETMLVRVAGAEHRAATGNCNEVAIQEARGAVMDLVHEHFPNYNLVSPPF